MKKRFLLLGAFALSCSLMIAVPLGADVPPPPVNQNLGIDDGVFNNLVEDDCRFCHENPDQFPVEDVSIPDRHHLLTQPPAPIPASSLIFTNPDSPTDPDIDNDGVNDTVYGCLNCHPDDPATPDVDFTVTRDCLLCHVQIDGAGSVHHLTATAQGTDSPLGDPNVGDCTPCHGTLVDDTGDGHFIPDYDPTPRTPTPSGGLAFPFNTRGNGAGACDYCHDQDTAPPAEPVLIFTNEETHHNTGLGPPVEDPLTSEKCAWCHDFTLPFEAQIRVCENCHGPDANHAIQADSDGDGVITPGIEMPGYGHIGDPDDCWGCHGFTLQAASSPGTGPVVPHAAGISASVLKAGTDTAVTVMGAAFTNMSEGVELTSNAVLTDAGGSSTTLIADTISENSLTVTIPGTMTTGNYDLRVVKDVEESNRLVIMVVPDVVITDDNCNKKKGVLTINGSGFGERLAGTEAYINVTVNDQTVDIISWSDTQIKASVNSCPNNAPIEVNALFGSAINTDGGGGPPPSEPEICDDGIDNDGDGQIDCDDRDCRKNRACKRRK